MDRLEPPGCCAAARRLRENSDQLQVSTPRTLAATPTLPPAGVAISARAGVSFRRRSEVLVVKYSGGQRQGNASEQTHPPTIVAAGTPHAWNERQIVGDSPAT